MGLIKFIFTFILIYFLLKLIRVLFFVNKTVKSHKEFMDKVNKTQHRSPSKKEEDIIDADYKVIGEEREK